jgi:hypothetical protein
MTSFSGRVQQPASPDKMSAPRWPRPNQLLRYHRIPRVHFQSMVPHGVLALARIDPGVLTKMDPPMRQEVRDLKVLERSDNGKSVERP